MNLSNQNTGNTGKLAELPPDHDIHHLTRSLSYIPEKRVALDIGAHQGIWTRELMKHFRCVHAFEPNRKNYEKLSDVLRETIGDGHAGIARRQAVGRFSGKGILLPGPENTGQYHLSLSDDLTEHGEEVTIVTIDEYPFHNVDFIKVDVEGLELDVLESAVETIERWKPAIMFEENGLGLKYYGIDPAAPAKFLESLGYREQRRFNKDYLYTCT